MFMNNYIINGSVSVYKVYVVIILLPILPVHDLFLKESRYNDLVFI